jgi:hypothetical protein
MYTYKRNEERKKDDWACHKIRPRHVDERLAWCGLAMLLLLLSGGMNIQNSLHPIADTATLSSRV